MRPDAGNEYQGVDLGGMLDIMIVATQLSSESDGFNNNEYDTEASLDFTAAASINQLKLALTNKEPNILLTEDIVTNESFTIDYNVNIDGNGKTIARADAAAFASREATEPFTGNVFEVTENSTLELTNVVLDGGAVWTGEYNSVLKRGTVNAGATATGSLVFVNSKSTAVLGEGVIIKNNVGANAVNVASGASLIIDGAEIINNNSSAGAIWGGGSITLNSGKINYNSSTGIAGAIRMASNSSFTMNGGEIKNNYATTVGGVFWGYNAATYNFNGGEISGNYAGEAAGVLWPGNKSTINVRNDVKIINNTSTEVGAFRLTNYTSFNMEGGSIYGNRSINNSNTDGIYGWDATVKISAGILADNITVQGGLTPTVGGKEIDGVVNFSISTNHNTCNLLSDFGVIKFTVAEGANFSAFNFKPEASYTYTEGDENKLICMNSGYSTYFDTASNTFKLKESN